MSPVDPVIYHFHVCGRKREQHTLCFRWLVQQCLEADMGGRIEEIDAALQIEARHVLITSRGFRV